MVSCKRKLIGVQRCDKYGVLEPLYSYENISQGCFLFFSQRFELGKKQCFGSLVYQAESPHIRKILSYLFIQQTAVFRKAVSRTECGLRSTRLLIEASLFRSLAIFKRREHRIRIVDCRSNRIRCVALEFLNNFHETAVSVFAVRLFASQHYEVDVLVEVTQTTGDVLKVLETSNDVALSTVRLSGTFQTFGYSSAFFRTEQIHHMCHSFTDLSVVFDVLIFLVFIRLL